MKRKNSGFSLVELIVVIAIMAVLVGVLAPAYLKYVEKSRKSADLDTLDVLVKAVDTIASDEDYTDVLVDGDEFIISVNGSGEVTAEVNGNADATKVWLELANTKGKFSLKSKASRASVELKGTYNGSTGAVTWDVGSTGILGIKEASNFVNKLHTTP